MRHAASTTICPSWIFSSYAPDMYITIKCQNIFFEGGWLNSIYLYLRGGESVSGGGKKHRALGALTIPVYARVQLYFIKSYPPPGKNPEYAPAPSYHIFWLFTRNPWVGPIQVPILIETYREGREHPKFSFLVAKSSKK